MPEKKKNKTEQAERNNPARAPLSSAFWHGVYGYLLALILLGVARLAGWLAGPDFLLPALAAAAGGLCLAFYAGLRAGLDKRFQDTRFAFAQCMAALLFVTAALPLLDPPLRPLLAMLPLFWLTAMFRYLSRRRLGALFTVLLFAYPLANLDLILARGPLPELGRQLLYWLVLLALYGGFALALRFARDTRRLVLNQQRELDRLRRQLADLALQDPLTSAYKRSHILRLAEQEKSRVDRYGGTFSLCLFAIDGLQEINRTAGMRVGDQVIRQVSEALQSGLRQSDNLGRFRGRHFLTILPATGLGGAEECAERLRVRVAGRRIDTHGGPVGLTLSAGVTQYAKGDSLSTTLERLEDAVARAAAGGGDRVETA